MKTSTTSKSKNKVLINKDELELHYLELQQSTPDIAKHHGCSKPTILKLLKEYQIPIRSGKEAHNTNTYISRLKEWTKGNTSCLGQVRSQASREKTSKALKGKPKSPEHVEKIRQASTGRIKTPETLEKARLAMLARYQNPEERKRSGAIMHQYHINHPEFSQKQTEILAKCRQNPETRRKHAENSRRAWTPERRVWRSAESKQMWQDPVIRTKLIEAHRRNWRRNNYATMRKMMMANNTKPNKPEKVVLSILNELFPNEWAFTGDGQVIISGLNPDFINTNGKKLIIEVFGDYWHTQKLKPYRINEGRIHTYAKYGYDTLIIWEHETKQPMILQEKILTFIQNNSGKEVTEYQLKLQWQEA